MPTKPKKTPAPATKKIEPAATPAPVTPAPAAAAPAPATKSTVAPKVKAPAEAPAVVAKPKGERVTIIAVIDVGFGNSLSIRGDQPALSWEKGLSLGNIHEGKWEIVLTGIESPFQFKFLVNDSGWSTGDNFTASPGDTLTITPTF